MIVVNNKHQFQHGPFGACSDCGAELLRTATGCVCPNGHGKIIPVVNHVGLWLRNLPQATRIHARHRWSIAGLAGEFVTYTQRPERKSWFARRRCVGLVETPIVVARHGPFAMCFMRVDAEAGSPPHSLAAGEARSVEPAGHGDAAGGLESSDTDQPLPPR